MANSTIRTCRWFFGHVGDFGEQFYCNKPTRYYMVRDDDDENLVRDYTNLCDEHQAEHDKHEVICKSVFLALDNAKSNGNDFTKIDVDAVILDLQTYDADLEQKTDEELRPFITAWQQDELSGIECDK